MSPGASAIARASARASLGEATPHRCMPSSTSITTPIVLSAATAARDSSPTWTASSTATVTVASRARSARARVFSTPTTSLITNTSSIPARAITMASQTVAQPTPIAPYSTSMRAMCGLLCTLTWARSVAGTSRMPVAMTSRFARSWARSSSRAGVARSSRGRPMSGP